MTEDKESDLPAKGNQCVILEIIHVSSLVVAL